MFTSLSMPIKLGVASKLETGDLFPCKVTTQQNMPQL